MLVELIRQSKPVPIWIIQSPFVAHGWATAGQENNKNFKSLANAMIGGFRHFPPSDELSHSYGDPEFARPGAAIAECSEKRRGVSPAFRQWLDVRRDLSAI